MDANASLNRVIDKLICGLEAFVHSGCAWSLY
jgi:hypothetical protein